LVITPERRAARSERNDYRDPFGLGKRAIVAMERVP